MPVEAVDLGQADHHTQRAAAWNDRGLVDRITLRQREPHDGVSRLVIGCLFLLIVGQDHGAAFRAHHHLVLGIFKIRHGHEATSDTGGHQGGLVHKVGEIGTREAGRTACDDAEIHVGAERCFACVHAKDLLAAFDIRVRHGHLTVKAARTQERRIENVFTVCSRNDDHAFIGFKTVHLDQELV